ncbi:SUMF1/EgtB/PvdO family nonheme iron enzyme, partial [Candidatus Marithioploca araucensis]|nr:SUMF1/EgtB/PvdO family nonheme iron enzyme [Candidatus Marithioploca araucensis]
LTRLFLISAIVAFSLKAVAVEQRIALVIGNSNYPSGVAYLPNPKNDAADMARVLRAYGFTVTQKQDLNQEEMDKAIIKFGQDLTKGGIGLFYFAGHGIQIDQRNYLVPIGKKIREARLVKYRAIDAQWVVDVMDSAGSRVNIVILDACRNNPYRSYFRSSDGLAAMHAPRGTIISFSTALGKKAADGEGRNGLYTKNLLKTIKIPGLTIEEVFKQTATVVDLDSGGRQIPWRSSSLIGEDFCFGTCDESEADRLRRQIAALQQQIDQREPVQPRVKRVPDKVFRDRLKDGGFGPEMVRIPAGRFQMGDIQGGGDSDEKPVHRVSIKQFAMGKYEVTVGEFRRFVNATGYKTEAEKGKGCRVYQNGWDWVKDANWRNPYFSQTDNHPVTCVSWNDAVAYAEWLNQQTGRQYRLPSEAEWEYAARAKTTTSRYWGNSSDDACRYANVHDKTSKKENGFSWTHHNCTDDYAKTAPVGSFKSNAFGLFDTVGNVWEWVADPWHNNYKNAPNEGQIWETGGDNSHRVLRGGSWDDGPDDCRAADRNGGTSFNRVQRIGFRVAARL